MRIIVDSGSDLTLEEINRYQLDFLPMSVTIGEKSYVDQLEINNQQIYQAIANGQRPMTSQPSIERIQELFIEIAQNKESAIYYAFSSPLSGTYQSAVMILEQVREDYPEVDITIIDSKSASRGLGMQIKEIIRLREEGISKDEIIAAITKMYDEIIHLFTVEDLNYLAKGGRLSKGSAFLGSLINIKPLLHVESGQLVPIGKYRGRKKVFDEIIKQMRNIAPHSKVEIAHSNDLNAAQQLKQKIAETYSTNDISIHEIGPTISSHTGQGTIALFYFKE